MGTGTGVVDYDASARLHTLPPRAMRWRSPAHKAMMFQSRKVNTVVGSTRHVWWWKQREYVSTLEASLDVRMIANCMYARACALCAIAIVVKAICFVKEASACAFKAAHRTCYCRVFLVQAGPFLAELRVSSGCQSFQRVCALSITHSSFDPSMSLESFLIRPHLRTVTFFMSGNEVPTCVSASVSVGAHFLSCTSGRVLAQTHVPPRVYSPTITTRVRWSKEHEEFDVDFGDDADVEADADVQEGVE